MEKTASRHLLTAIAVICALGCTVPTSGAATLPYDEGVIGDLQQYKILGGESLFEIARKFDLGLNEIADANPGVDPFTPRSGTLVDIPTAWILPEVPMRSGIVVNIPEFRLYYFPRELPGQVATFPLGIGDEGRVTPVGSYTVIEKIANPSWYVPKSIRSESPHLPKVVPPGPDNPMGSHALRLSLPVLLIHGTNRPWGIGSRSSHGCLRLYPEDIVKLFALVPKGTQVAIVNQPVKAGARGERVFVEAHRAPPEECSVESALQLLADKNLVARTDFTKLIRVVAEMTGVPVDVTVSAAHPSSENK
jgi:L,D-transpeptidase ErfK/SrfK